MCVCERESPVGGCGHAVGPVGGCDYDCVVE